MQFLCNLQPDNSFSVWNKIGTGFWQLLSYGTECHCCHAYRAAFFALSAWAVGVATPWYVGATYIGVITGAAFLVGHKFAKDRK